MEIQCKICQSFEVGGCPFCQEGYLCSACRQCSNSACNKNRQNRIAQKSQCSCGAPRKPFHLTNPSRTCFYCNTTFFCDFCQSKCSSPQCEERERKAFASFLGPPQLYDYKPVDDQRLHRFAEKITEDVPQNLKRRRESDPQERYNAPRHGNQTPEGGTSATIRLNPVDIAVISWNINHFNKADSKKRVIRWLFERHPWLDVIVLQEINESSVPELVNVLSGMEDIGYDLGPKMNGCSPVEEGPAKP
ncbi:MAG TPA: hypothetical protein VGL53_26405, partial [Bryobacteraceae bacterium]